MTKARTLLMVSPDHFGFNSQTAVSNAFQKNQEIENSASLALQEFKNAVDEIRKNDIEVIPFPSPENTICPDAVFPNNWFSTHSDGTLLIYPMLTPNRRAERNQKIIDYLKQNYRVNEIVDFSERELKNQIVEGTGSIVFDHENKLAYACISPRTHEKLLNEICQKLNYQSVVFESFGPSGEQVYHTNVVMAVAKKYVVICLESIENPIERNMIKEKIQSTGKILIEISFSQMMNFAGNMLEVENKYGKSFIILSETAYQSLNDDQKKIIRNYSEFLRLKINTIETIGGGSARCMLAEIYLEKR